MKWELTYDAEADCMYIGFGRGASRYKSYMNFDGDVVLDLADGTVVGIEIIGASTHPVFKRLMQSDASSFREGNYHE